MAIGKLADVRQKWNGPEVQAQIQRSVGRGLQAAAVFFAARLKELLSVPAPRATVTDPFTGQRVTVSTSPASAGAPPRKLTGRLRGSITWEQIDKRTVRVGTNVVYAPQLEYGGTIFAKSARSLRWLTVSGKGKRQQVGQVFRGSVTQAPHPFLTPAVQRWRADVAKIISRA